MSNDDAPLVPGRRDALGAFALSALPLAGLAAPADADAAWSEQFDAFDFAAARSCALIPQETAGPFPLLKVLGDERMLRRDMAEGRPGVPLALTLKLVDIGRACAPIANAAVYAWACDKDGAYSGYQQPGGIDTRGQTFMRGVQLSNANGVVRFDAIYPGWYPGRITHIHFQVYLNANRGASLSANPGGSATATSQLVFPQAVSRAVYDSPLYAARGQNTSVKDFAQDGIFRDGVSLQLAKTKGSVESGFAAKLLVGVAG
jgi:protocatechuate 3,4-dioxygenase beta subunit